MKCRVCVGYREERRRCGSGCIPPGALCCQGTRGQLRLRLRCPRGRPGWDTQQRQDIVLFHRSLPISMFLGARAFSLRVLGRNLGLRGPAGAGSPRDTPPVGSRSEVTGPLSAALPQLFCLWPHEFERKQLYLFFPAAVPQILHPSGSDVLKHFWAELVFQVSGVMV